MLGGGGPARCRQLEVNIAVSDLSAARSIPNAVRYLLVILATSRVLLGDFLPRIYCLMDIMRVLCFCSTQLSEVVDRRATLQAVFQAVTH